jgi:GNAT superfamily N-acetyltransferase
MSYVRVQPDDAARVQAVADVWNAARAVDDPEAFPSIPEMLAGQLRYGWDLEPGECFLYYPGGAEEAVGVLELELPARDNLHLVWGSITVHPAHRRSGHGSAMMGEILRRAQAAGRSTIWLEAVEDDPDPRKFLESFGFRCASSDARRRQVLADVDQDEIERLWCAAEKAAAGYRLERLPSPAPEDVLADLAAVTAVINDAPMGELTYEHEVYDTARIRDIETARQGRDERCYRLLARHRETGEIAGHTLVVRSPHRERSAGQGDTAVARAHRGHKLGLLLKIAMMRWIAEVAPQVEVIETYNNVDNRYMIDVNEAIGYRLSQVFATFERNLTGDREPPADARRRDPQKPSRFSCFGSRCHSFITLTRRSR